YESFKNIRSEWKKRKIVGVCGKLKEMIAEESTRFSPNQVPFAHLIGESAVGKLISSISAKTSAQTVESLSTLSEEELSEHFTLAKGLNENNPKEKATQLRMRSRRVTAVASTITSKTGLVSDAEAEKLKNLATIYKSAKDAAEIASRQFQESEPLLQGTGGDAWKDLFEAAKKFALIAYPDKVFIDLEADSPCPLCQQPLAEGRERLSRFEAFIQQTTEQTSRDRYKALNDAYKLFSTQNLSLEVDEETYDELRELDENLSDEVRSFASLIIKRHQAIRNALKTSNWEEVNPLPSCPDSKLLDLAGKLANDATTLEKAANEDERVRLLKRFNELDARVKLGQVKKQVLDCISQMVHQAKLKACLPSVKPNSISLKSSKITDQVVSAELAIALNDEFKALGVNNLSVSLQSRTERGKPRHKLRIDLPYALPPSEILSEGEQRAIAIASFLAEMRVSKRRGGIIFDDPMSSLDHRRRERIARRLVEEASSRQVIVFTHDIFFLCLLSEEAAGRDVNMLTQSLIRQPIGFGVTKPELPFEGQKTSQRVGALRTMLVDAVRFQKTGDEEGYRQKAFEAYVMLRMAWEYAVEEVLFRNVVLRFRKGVSTQRLSQVEVEDSDYDEIEAGMTRCSNYAHARAFLSGASIPDADDLSREIEALESWRKKVETRANETQKRRKKK
ncbi:MAG: AAA family ATPase, partial [Herbaspirillum sp.]